jgi:hypothetical protein
LSLNVADPDNNDYDFLEIEEMPSEEIDDESK